MSRMNRAIQVAKEKELFLVLEEARGQIVLLPRGRAMMSKIRSILDALNRYTTIQTPAIYHESLWRRSGHLSYFKESMFSLSGDDNYLKPMSCPAHFLIWEATQIHRKDLPLRLREYGVVHRKEAYGAIKVPFRMLSFTQDDMHVLCTWGDLNAVLNEFVVKLRTVYARLGFAKVLYKVCLSDTDDEEVRMANQLLVRAVIDINLTADLDHHGGAFYGPKIEAHLLDNDGRWWQCGTIQVDLSATKKFKIRTVDASEKLIVLHQACLGSLERFVGIMLDNYGYMSLPLCIHPKPFVLFDIADGNLHEFRDFPRFTNLIKVHEFKRTSPCLLFYGHAERTTGKVKLQYTDSSGRSFTFYVPLCDMHFLRRLMMACHDPLSFLQDNYLSFLGA